jgi:hypothetical protein
MSSFSSKLIRRLRATRDAIGGADRARLVQVIAFASSVPLLMRLRPRTLERLLSLPQRRPDALSDEAAGRIVDHLQTARRIASPLVRAGCLTRGLTLYYFLRRAGYDVTLCFGIGRVGSEFTGHCWLSRAGAPFLEATDPRSRYAHVFSIPLSASHPDSHARLRDMTCP